MSRLGPAPGQLGSVEGLAEYGLIHGRDFVIPDDVKMVTSDVLGHRIILNIEDVLEGVNPQDVVEEVVGQVPVPTELGHRSTS